MEIQRLNALLTLEPLTPKVDQTKPDEAGGIAFGEMLEKALQQVEQDQKQASEMAVKTATGDIADIAEAMIASERASLSLSLAIQVRNKVIEAYQEIMRMPL